MRVLKIILVILVLGILAVPMVSCGSESDEAELPENQIATAQRGDITIDITAAGNLALSRTEDLAFDLFYGQSGATGTKGTVGEVLVEEGDTVEEGQVLVTVDKDEWNDQLSILEDQVTSKERALVEAKINLQTARQNLKDAQDNKDVKALAVLNAQIGVDTAKDDLTETIKLYDWDSYETIESELNKAEEYYDYALEGLQDASGESSDRWLLLLERAEEQLELAQANYDNFVSGRKTDKIDLKEKQVKAAEMTLAQSQEDLDEVAADVALKELQATLNEGKVKDAEKALVDAQEDLEEALSKSPEITAPFAGFITTVNVEGGDEVVTGTVAVQLADPEKFEADILVSEMDILQVKIGGEALVEVDAMPGMSLPAKVTHIAPTATIQSGVVNYEVKVEVESLEAVATEKQESRQEVSQEPPPGWLPPPLQQAVDEGRLTRERAEELMKQGPPPGMELPPGMEVPPGMEGAAGQEAPAASQTTMPVPEDFQLREGLTVTVSILVAEKTDVPLVPNAAITSEGGQTYVQVESPSGGAEQRAIQTGISDYQFTEVTEGLKEGEQVLIPQGTATTSTTTSSGPPRMGLFGPGPPR